jgi:hypothetical protein
MSSGRGSSSSEVVNAIDRRYAQLIEIAIWMSFLGLLARGFDFGLGYIRHTGRFAIDLAAVILGLVGAHAVLLRRAHAVEWSVSRTILLVFLVFATLSAAVTGLLNENSPVGWLLYGIIPFSGALAIRAVRADFLFGKLVRAFTWQTAIAVAATAFVFLFFPPHDRLEWNGPAGNGLAKSVARCLFGVPFLAGVHGMLSRRQRIWLGLGLLSWCALAISGSSRGLLLTLVGVIPAAAGAAAWKRGYLRKYVGVTAVLTVLALLIAGFGELGYTKSDYLSDRWSESVAHLARLRADEVSVSSLSEGTYETATDELFGQGARANELRDFVGQLDPRRVTFGEGFGGRWRSIFWGIDWPIVHFGPAHLVLQGGLPLLLAFLLVVGVAVWDAWASLATYAPAAGALAFLGTYLASFIQHGVPSDDPWICVLWVSIGLAFEGGALRRIGAPAVSP